MKAVRKTAKALNTATASIKAKPAKAKTIWKKKKVKHNGKARYIYVAKNDKPPLDVHAYILNKLVIAIQVMANMPDLDDHRFDVLACAIEKVAVRTTRTTNPQYLTILANYARVIEALAHYYTPKKIDEVGEGWPFGPNGDVEGSFPSGRWHTP